MKLFTVLTWKFRIGSKVCVWPADTSQFFNKVNNNDSSQQVLGTSCPHCLGLRNFCVSSQWICLTMFSVQNSCQSNLAVEETDSPEPELRFKLSASRMTHPTVRSTPACSHRHLETWTPGCPSLWNQVIRIRQERAMGWGSRAHDTYAPFTVCGTSRNAGTSCAG